MCYAVMSGQLGDQSAQESLKSSNPESATTDTAEVGRQSPCDCDQGTEQLRQAAISAGKA